jgi:hypothetical protein
VRERVCDWEVEWGWTLFPVDSYFSLCPPHLPCRANALLLYSNLLKSCHPLHTSLF